MSCLLFDGSFVKVSQLTGICGEEEEEIVTALENNNFNVQVNRGIILIN